MLGELSHEYETLRETLVVFCPNDPSFIETKVRERYQDLQAQSVSKKHSSVALVSRTERKSGKKHNKKPKSSSESDSSRKNNFQGKCFKCWEKGHLRENCLARIIAHPTQTGKSEADEDESGEKSDVSYLECLLARRSDVIVQACEEFRSMMHDVSGLKCLLTSRDDLILSAVNKDMIVDAVNKSRYFEDWYADTGTAFHMTDYLACMKDLKSCQKNVNGIAGVSCEVYFSGTLELVFVTADSKFSVELKNALYSPNLGYNLFSPSAEFDGESWNGLGGPDGVMTAFQGQVTFSELRWHADCDCVSSSRRLYYWYSVGCPYSFKPQARNHDGCERVLQHLCSFPRGIASYYCKATRYQVDW